MKLEKYDNEIECMRLNFILIFEFIRSSVRYKNFYFSFRGSGQYYKSAHSMKHIKHIYLATWEKLMHNVFRKS